MSLHISTSGIDYLPAIHDSLKATGAEHLCVLVHGLWGNPNHLWYLKQQLRATYPEDKLHILVAKRNTGSFTYDGIETGGERVTKEVEDTVEELERQGTTVKKLSMIGYSLGGLVARYAVGLLDSKGFFNDVEPVNFTTFATPHLGVRSPLLGYHNQLWNVLGARALAISGQQLFLIDKFRDTGRPLLSVLADPDSIFIRALVKFKHKSLYANVINDRSAVWYTTGISRVDPFVDLGSININYLPGFAPVILDPSRPFSRKDASEPPATFRQRLTSEQGLLKQMPFLFFIFLFLPIGSVLFLFNAAIQSLRSRQRIALHQQGKLGIHPNAYSFPLMVNDMRRAAEDMYENINAEHGQEYLPEGTATDAAWSGSPLASPKHSRHNSAAAVSETKGISENGALSNGSAGWDDLSTENDDDESGDELKTLLERRETEMQFPTLALTPAQFAMIKALDEVGFKKYPVFIHSALHSHAAIIVRMNRARFEDGKVVVKHWVGEFEI